MTRKFIPFLTLAVLFAFFALARPTGSAAQAKKEIALARTAQVAITSVALVASGCGVEVTCLEVKWNVLSPPANPQVMTFEVGGKLNFVQGNACNTNVKTITDHTARSAKIGVFQGGACNGTVKSADATVKLFTRDIEGQKVLTSTANKSQTF
jgi:hypothetical protein